MTVAETQTLLNTIHGHIDGKSGAVYGLEISNGKALVTIDWEAFQSNFSGTSAEQTGTIWSKTVGDVTYMSKQTNNSTATNTVPTP